MRASASAICGLSLVYWFSPCSVHGCLSYVSVGLFTNLFDCIFFLRISSVDPPACIAVQWTFKILLKYRYFYIAIHGALYVLWWWLTSVKLIFVSRLISLAFYLYTIESPWKELQAFPYLFPMSCPVSAPKLFTVPRKLTVSSKQAVSGVFLSLYFKGYILQSFSPQVD